jgi:pimeloyl-ACP methyl ester carboxylesterase
VLRPETRYVKSGPYNIAYQVVGDGDIDLLWIHGFVSNVELAWEEPRLASFLSRLASFSRLITFDKRGTGMSDRVVQDELPTLEERMEDVVAVLDAAGSERAALFSHSEGGTLAALFAATHPEQTIALVTAGIFAKRVWSPDYPWAPKPEAREKEIAELESTWGTDADVEHLAPSTARDPIMRQRLAAYFRRSASPGAAAALIRMNTEIDVRDVLPTIRVPTLILHRSGDRDASVEEGRWIAERVPGAQFVELSGDDHLPWAGDQDRLLDEVERFLTGRLPAVAPDRVLATVLVTDIVGSTERAAELGDRGWRDLLEQHHAAVRRELAAFGGDEVDTAGDGFLATFEGPGRAIRAAVAITERTRALDVPVRTGIHTGECERIAGKVGGIAVHIAARIAAAARPGEVLVSRTVKDLVAGSGVVFEERGARSLKGVPDEWELFAVTAP